MPTAIRKDMKTAAPSNDDYKVSQRRIKLDRIDRQILSDLQESGRMTNVELAERSGISAPPCLRRVRALEETGFIEGYHADVNATALGYSITVFAHVGLKNQSETALSEFEESVNSWEQVRECYMLAGDTDFLLKIVAKDWDDYQQFVTRKLTAAPHVGNVKSSLAIRSAKRLAGVPIEVDKRPAAQKTAKKATKADKKEAA